LSLQALIQRPYELLVELERRAKAAIAARQGDDVATDEWVGIGFRLGAEQFVAGRSEVREVLPVPEQITRIPGSKPWLRGIANVRGQLLTVADLRSFLGAGRAPLDRHARILLVASREVPTALIVDLQRAAAGHGDPLRALSKRSVSPRRGSLAEVQFARAARGSTVPERRRIG
jgi:twitching motility protein PilI